jgi:thymidylate synthase ThyX
MEEGLLRMGIKAEDARYVRPNAAVTNIVTSMNPRQLLHVLSLRCASDAQWEIRDIAWAMFACAKLVAPSIFETLPSATANSYIRERIVKLDRAVKQVEPVFATSPVDKLVEIPVEEVGLQHAVKAFVRRIREE